MTKLLVWRAAHYPVENIRLFLNRRTAKCFIILADAQWQLTVFRLVRGRMIAHDNVQSR